jgi:hypothetical protein
MLESQTQSKRSRVAKRAAELTKNAAERAAPIATATFAQGKALATSKIGSRALTGAAAGAAIAAVLPFVTIAGGVLLGAGGLVLWKSAKDAD